MPWTEKSVTSRRLCFIAACLRHSEPMSDPCHRFGVSRKTGYKWLGRYQRCDATGLEDLSSARHTGLPKDWGGHATLANIVFGAASASKRWPSPEPSSPL
jgi:putative transposase